jgi:hypothetical protein
MNGKLGKRKQPRSVLRYYYDIVVEGIDETKKYLR